MLKKCTFILEVLAMANLWAADPDLPKPTAEKGPPANPATPAAQPPDAAQIAQALERGKMIREQKGLVPNALISSAVTLKVGDAKNGFDAERLNDLPPFLGRVLQCLLRSLRPVQRPGYGASQRIPQLDAAHDRQLRNEPRIAQTRGHGIHPLDELLTPLR